MLPNLIACNQRKFSSVAWPLLCMSLVLALDMHAEAASIDCAKAKTNVEHLICNKSGITKIDKLDEEMATLYKEVLKGKVNAELNKQEQMQWLKRRDACPDSDCLIMAYLDRKSQLEDALAQIRSIPASPEDPQYEISMSKNDELCSHMYQLMRDDLKQHGRIFNRMYTFFNRVDEFNQFNWQPVIVSNLNKYDAKVYYWNAVGALFDLNNDGVMDFVVKDLDHRNMLIMLDHNLGDASVKLEAKSLMTSDNILYLNNGVYDLREQQKENNEFENSIQPGWVMPFLYKGITYLYIQSKYPDNEPEHLDVAVIAKYGSGKFLDRDMSGKMDDICYIERK
jgi:uncharacterized protein